MSEFNNLSLEDREYIINLPSHLAEASMADDFCKILSEFEFLQHKISISEVQLLIEDYDLSIKLQSDFSENQIKSLQLLQQTLQQASRILQQDKTQLVEQLFGRLSTQANPYLEALLKEAKNSKKDTWLCSIQPSLTSSQGALIRILEGHTQLVTDCSLSDDGKIGLSGSRDCTLRVWNLEKGTCEHILMGHNSQINACSISGDGKIALSASKDKTLRLWDTKTGHCLHILKEHKEKVTDCTVSKDGKIALSSSDDGTLRVWDVKTGERLLIFEEHTDRVSCCDLSSDGKKALSGSHDQTLRLWNTETGECLSIVENELGAFTCCSLSGDGHFALSLSDVMILENDPDAPNEILISSFSGKNNNDSSSVKLANLNDLSDEQQKDLSEYISYMLKASDLSADMLKENFLVKLWDLEKNQCIYIFQEENFTTKCKLTEDGKIALSSTMGGGEIKVWDTKIGECLSSLSTSSTFVSALATNKRGSLALSASDNGDIRLWNIEEAINNSSKNLLSGKGNLISGCGYNQNGSQAFSISGSGTIQIWNTKTGSSIKEIQIHTAFCFECLISSALETGLLCLLDDMLHNLYLINLNSAECLLVLDEHNSQISRFAMSDNGKIVVSASKDEFHLIGIKNHKYGYTVLEEYSETTEKLLSCDLNENGSIIISAYDNGLLRIRNLRNKSLIDIETRHTDKIVECIISRDGLIAISSAKDGTLKIWDTITSNCLGILLTSSDLHHCVISPNGQLLLYSQARDTIQIVSIKNGQVIGKFTFDSWVSRLAFSPDSKQIMVGDYSGCVHFLQLEGLTKFKEESLHLIK
jgi:WD40 repeat protein